MNGKVLAALVLLGLLAMQMVDCTEHGHGAKANEKTEDAEVETEDSGKGHNKMHPSESTGQHGKHTETKSSTSSGHSSSKHTSKGGHGSRSARDVSHETSKGEYHLFN